MTTQEDSNQYRDQRIQKMKDMWEKGVHPYPNGIQPQHLALKLHEEFAQKTKEELEQKTDEFSLAGRVMAIRSFGKAAFVQLQDRSGRFQIFIQKGSISDDAFDLFKTLDVGDFIFVKGPLFRTKTDELSLKAHQFQLIVKSLRLLPEKWHGLTDVETRYRQRYVDLIVNPEVKQTFVMRSKIVQAIREFFVARDFLEVETPMMHPIPGGAAARPFVTHHNTLDLDLFLRIAPELYLKRLVVGGLERVFEINRNFRNEGISIQHNPEFTMLEFYQAYATYEDLIQLTQELLNQLAVKICGSEQIEYQGTAISFKAPFRRVKFLDSLIEIGKLPEEVLKSREAAFALSKKLEIKLKHDDEDHLAILTEIFEKVVEPKLIDPTFITHYPTEVSPLSRKNDQDSRFVDRFELFIYGREISNAFSELNDPIDQKERFLKQVTSREKGDDEAMFFDDDYIRALEYGMPPTAGQGIGIDRLVMLLTNQASIRDVILFPQLRREQHGA
ncbi:MAG: lysine--tRNA ligase [Deltaproteobacteria bacterium]|nr:lysine--tRNA ligase [Deltaproteobacteria bacterium]